MDPIANLQAQRALAANLLRLTAKDPTDLSPSDERQLREAIAADARALAEHVLDLDEWRSKGGFDPYPTCPTG